MVIMWILRTADGIIARVFFSVGFFTEHDNIREMIRSGIQGRGELVQHPRRPKDGQLGRERCRRKVSSRLACS